MNKHTDAARTTRSRRNALELQATALIAAHEIKTDREREAEKAERLDEAILGTVSDKPTFSDEPTSPREVVTLSDDDQDQDELSEGEEALNEVLKRARLKQHVRIEPMRIEPHTREMLLAQLAGLRVSLRHPQSTEGADLDASLFARTMRRLERGDVMAAIARIRSISIRQAQRHVERGRKRWASIVRIATNLNLPDDAVLAVLEDLPRETQLAVAHEAERQRELWAFEKTGRQLERISVPREDRLRALDAIGKNDAHTRARLVAMSAEDQLAELVNLTLAHKEKQKRDKFKSWRQNSECPPLAPTLGGLSAAWDVASHADRAKFLEAHGLRKATTIPGECISIAFGDVSEQCEQ